MSRDSSIDALKGLAITLVVLGHAILDAGALPHAAGLVDKGSFSISIATASNLALSMLYTFHMPLFAFVSGLVMWPPRKYSLGSSVVGRLKSLIVPYLAWFTVFYIVRWAPHPSGGFGVALMDEVTGHGGLWYLYALFICSIFVVALSNVRGSMWLLSASAVAAIACSTGLLFAVPDVLYLNMVLWIYPFVVLGYLVGPLKEKLVERRRALLGVGLAAFLPLFYLRHPVDVPSIQPITRIGSAAGAIGGSSGHVLAALFSVIVPVLLYACATAAVVALYGAYVGRTGPAIDVQAWLGRKSLGIYAIHGSVLWFMSSHGLKNPVLLTALVIGIAVLGTMALERTPVLGHILLGQKWSFPMRRKVATEPSIASESAVPEGGAA